MYSQELENLINAALADGVLTDRERQILHKRAQAEGVDLDEFDMLLDARVLQAQKAAAPAVPPVPPVPAAPAAPAPAKPKSDKVGDMRKCPACGALVPAFSGRCPECGYEFSNVEVNQSIKQLADLLMKEHDEAHRCTIIETFPVPNAKADLLELLTFLKPYVNGDVNPFTLSCFNKYQQCVEKIRLSFAGDKQFQSFIDELPAIKKRITMKRRTQSVTGWMGRHKFLTGVIVIVLICMLASLCESISK